jgi:uncharacterized protein YlzI (FlbEa/FlbD family)
MKLIHPDGKIITDEDDDNPVPDDFTGIIEESDGYKEWYQNGFLHRLDGPAIEYSNGTKSYFINGKRFDSQESWQEEVDKINEKNSKGSNKMKYYDSDGKIVDHHSYDDDIPIPYDFTGIAEWENGDKFWFKTGNLHREDGPACEYPNGAKKYYINGKRFDSQESWQEEVDKINGKKNTELESDSVTNIPVTKENSSLSWLTKDQITQPGKYFYITNLWAKVSYLEIVFVTFQNRNNVPHSLYDGKIVPLSDWTGDYKFFGPIPDINV